MFVVLPGQAGMILFRPGRDQIPPQYQGHLHLATRSVLKEIKQVKGRSGKLLKYDIPNMSLDGTRRIVQAIQESHRASPSSEVSITPHVPSRYPEVWDLPELAFLTTAGPSNSQQPPAVPSSSRPSKGSKGSISSRARARPRTPRTGESMPPPSIPLGTVQLPSLPLVAALPVHGATQPTQQRLIGDQNGVVTPALDRPMPLPTRPATPVASHRSVKIASIAERSMPRPPPARSATLRAPLPITETFSSPPSHDTTTVSTSTEISKDNDAPSTSTANSASDMSGTLLLSDSEGTDALRNEEAECLDWHQQMDSTNSANIPDCGPAPSPSLDSATPSSTGIADYTSPVMFNAGSATSTDATVAPRSNGVLDGDFGELLNPDLPDPSYRTDWSNLTATALYEDHHPSLEELSGEQPLEPIPFELPIGSIETVFSDDPAASFEEAQENAEQLCLFTCGEGCNLKCRLYHL